MAMWQRQLWGSARLIRPRYALANPGRVGDPDFLYVARSYDCVCGFQ